MRQKAKVEAYDAPAGGWGSLNAVVHILTQEEVAVLGSEILLQQNKPDGFMCVSCSWAKPAKPHPFEFCENGAKATAWEITGKTRDARVLRAAHARPTCGPGPITNWKSRGV